MLYPYESRSRDVKDLSGIWECNPLWEDMD